MDTRVTVRGIAELTRAFKAVDEELPKHLKTRFLAVAETVANQIKSKVPFLSGAARSSIVAKASSRTAGIAFGGNRAPYYFWLDFGGKVGRHKSISRPLVQGGRFVYPTIVANQAEILAGAEQAVVDTATEIGFETKGD